MVSLWQRMDNNFLHQGNSDYEKFMFNTLVKFKLYVGFQQVF